MIKKYLFEKTWSHKFKVMDCRLNHYHFGLGHPNKLEGELIEKLKIVLPFQLIIQLFLKI